MTRSSVPPPVTAVMDAASAWLPERMTEVEESLGRIAVGYGPTLGEEAKATLTAGGKRLRPLLVLIAAGQAGGSRAATASVSRPGWVFVAAASGASVAWKESSSLRPA